VPRNPSCPLVLDKLELCNKLVRQHSYEHFEHFLILLCGRKPFDLKKRMNSTSPVWGKYRRRRADLTRSGGGGEDPEASAVERTADLRRIFRPFFLRAKTKAMGEE